MRPSMLRNALRSASTVSSARSSEDAKGSNVPLQILLYKASCSGVRAMRSELGTGGCRRASCNTGKSEQMKIEMATVFILSCDLLQPLPKKKSRAIANGGPSPYHEPADLSR